MSELLDALIAQRKEGALAYKDYLARVVELTRQAKAGPSTGGYPTALTTKAQRALFDNLSRDEAVALRVDQAVRTSMQDDWRSSAMKTRRVRQAIAAALGDDATAEQVEATLELVKSQNDY
jgi:type I restriction enzyme, R subunit